MDSGSGNQRLLVVDDEPFNLEIICEYFDGEGFVVDTAAHGEAAWSLLNVGAEYAAILLDRMMPVLDGLALLKRIKADERFNQIPVIMQTAAGSPEQVREGLAAGAYYYLVKPYEKDSLVSIVRAALGDRAFRLNLRRKLEEHADALQLMASGCFQFRTVDEAAILAAFVAQACPQREAALLTLSELMVNAVEHGNLGITYEEKTRLRREERWHEEVARRQSRPENAGKLVRVDIVRDRSGLSIRIADKGEGFDWKRYLEFDPARAFDPNGRGIALARMSGAATIQYLGCGNEVMLRVENGKPDQV